MEHYPPHRMARRARYRTRDPRYRPSAQK